jgi:D-serine deaminase-like pyridoxal phosphate-dependent protein
MRNNLDSTIIGIEFKGFPLESYGVSIKDFILSKPNIFKSGFQFPLMVLKKDALMNNINLMAKYCASVGAELAPHVKTTMSPQIAKLQVDAGACALTIANLWQAEVFRKFGFNKLIIANEVLDQNSINRISNLNKSGQAEIIFYVDSLNGLDIIKKFTPKNGLQNLFIEIGTDNGRGGVRDLYLVKQIAEAINQDSRLQLRGVTGFEGAVPNANRTNKGEEDVRNFCRKIVSAAEVSYEFRSQHKFIISAGGSAYFEIVAEELNKFDKEKIFLLRSGGYVTHDSKYYEEIYPFRSSVDKFQPAIEVWAQVISNPEPGFGVLNLGKRDVGSDLHNPIPIRKYSKNIESFSGLIEKLNDQHAFMKSSESFENADLIGLGVSHPCTTFDKWRLIPLVNDNYVVVDCIHTFF